MAGKFRLDLHPRGAKGRFASKGLKVITKSDKGTTGQTVNRKRKGTTTHGDIHRAKLEIMAELGQEQRKRLRSILAKQAVKPKPVVPPTGVATNTHGSTTPSAAAAPLPEKKKRKKREPVAADATSSTEPNSTKPKSKVEFKSTYTKEDFAHLTNAELEDWSNKRAPTDRRIASKKSIEVDPQGNVTIWKGSDNAKFDKSFKYGMDKKFEYSVVHEGKEITLNRHKGVIRFEGEVVKGIPPTDPRLRTVKTQSVVDRMVTAMGYVEDKGNKAPAPDWLQNVHGKIEDKSLVRSRKGVGDYGGMQIHHVNQWARESFGTVQEQHGYKKKISPAEAKKAMEGLLRTETVDGKTGYCIDVKSKKDRELVILAGGLHDINSPLYKANHPHGYNPDTGKLQAFGIPKADGDGSRNEFNVWTAGFWKEYHRREAFVYRAELARRVRSGEVKPEEVQGLVDTAFDKAKKSKAAILVLRAGASSYNKALKAQRDERGVKKKKKKAPVEED